MKPVIFKKEIGLSNLLEPSMEDKLGPQMYVL